MTDRAALIAKLKALLAKTVENGCTEAEAAAALEKAQAWRDAHDVSDAELLTGGEAVTIEPKAADDRQEIRVRLVDAVGAFCHCRAWREQAIDTLTFAGLQSDVVFAHWLLDTLADFVRRSLADWLDATTTAETGRTRYTDRRDFTIGCCSRLAARLRELAARSQEASTGLGLVLAKGALIDRHLADQGIELQQPRARQRGIRVDAWRAGDDAGDRARFDRPLNGRDRRRLIGR